MDEEKNLTRREFVVRSGVVIGAGVLLSSPIGSLAADVIGSRVRTRGYAAFDTSGKLSPWSFERRAVGDNDILLPLFYETRMSRLVCVLPVSFSWGSLLCLPTSDRFWRMSRKLILMK